MTAAGDGAPLGIAFVGQAVYFEQCALHAPAGSLQPSFIDYREGAPIALLLARLAELDPDVVVVFRPEIVPKGAFDGLCATTIGYLTEPLPRDPRRSHADLRARLDSLRAVDPGNFDRIVSFDPLMASTASEVLPVWRSLPIPVGDEMFLDVRERSAPPTVLFIGRSTDHRERLLAAVKADSAIIHIGHGLFGPRLHRFLGRTDVQINLHNNPYPTFENRVSLALAAGHLVISEPLSPEHGLVAGRDFLEITSPAELANYVRALETDREAFLEVQLAGRAAAERFRASTVYPELVHDAMSDIAARGTGRRSRGA